MAEPRAQQEQELVWNGTDEARMATPPTRMSAAMEVADHDTSAMHGKQGSTIPARTLSIRYFAYYIIFGINTKRIMARGCLFHGPPFYTFR